MEAIGEAPAACVNGARSVTVFPRTATPKMPSTACSVSDHLGLKGAPRALVEQEPALCAVPALRDEPAAYWRCRRAGAADGRGELLRLRLDTETDRGGLYEFELADGLRVYLHDCALRRISYVLGGVASLALGFVYDPEWVPKQLVEQPLIRLTFEQARILEWDEDEDSVAFAAEHADAVHDVRDLGWNGADLFDLQTTQLRLLFVARRVSVTTHQAEGR